MPSISADRAGGIHAEELRVDTDRIYLIGQFAGGQLTSLNTLSWGNLWTPVSSPIAVTWGSPTRW